MALAGGFTADVAHGQAPRPTVGVTAPAPPPSGRGGVSAPAPTPGAGRRPAATVPAGGGNPLAPAPEQVSDLSTRYRLIERYTTAPARSDPADVGQYRVALRDVVKIVTDNPQGAPDRTEATFQIIFTEAPAVINSSGVVTDSVRRYEAFRVNPLPPGSKPSDPRPLEGLTVWEKFRLGGSPLMISLTPERSLSETDYSTNTHVVLMPEIAAALPALPSHIGARWRLPKNAATALFGDRPMEGEPLTGTLLDVRKTERGADMEAIIGVTGRAKMPPKKVDTLLNAQIVFTFTPPAPTAAPAGGIVEARGRITTVRLAISSVSALPGGTGRLRKTFTREKTLQRPVDDVGAPLAIPEEPKPTLENSWLTFHDFEDRFNFRHPQDLQYDTHDDEEDAYMFVRPGLGGPPEKVFQIKALPTTGKTDTDRNNRDPEFHIKAFVDTWRKGGQDFLRGPSAWLPEADWNQYRLKVYRFEAALKLTARLRATRSACSTISI